MTRISDGLWRIVKEVARHLLRRPVVGIAAGIAPMREAPDTTAANARNLVTDTMATTVPSLDDLLKTWRAGLSPETLVPD